MAHPQLIGENTHSQVQCRYPMETPNITVCVLGGDLYMGLVLGWQIGQLL